MLAPTIPVSATSLEAATAGHLRYVSDTAPGITRIRSGRGFRYRGADGKAIRDPQVLSRIRALAIPPAWSHVWICALPHGHIQAVGRDTRGRKQYRYHARWREVRDETKYARLIAFGQALSRIRRRLQHDLAGPALSRERVLATVVRLLETTLIRVGNEEYARQNGSYGLTTLRAKHVRVRGTRVRFEFRGKGGKRHVVDLSDRRLARVVQQCQELPGHELFQYLDEAGHRQTIDSADVNAYLREIAGDEFTAKDFRTWAGTVLAATTLGQLAAASEARPIKAHVVQAVAAVAERLRNTPSICRRCYIHPAIIDAYQSSTLAPPLAVVARGSRQSGLQPVERAVLRLLKTRARQRAR